jgi:DNA-binding CsgD family transcriptional regulator
MHHDWVVSAVERAAVLLEREHELAVLTDRLDEVRIHGQGRIVLASGEAGSGKTSLLARFAVDVAEDTLKGACDPLFTPRPLGPLLDVAREVDGLDELIRGAVGAHDVAAVLALHFRRHPGSAFMLEDLHWADEATLDVVKLLARRIEAVPALVVLSYRDDELDVRHPLRLVLGDLAPMAAVSRIRLRALSPAAVEELATPAGMDGGELYRKTVGNPFFVVEAIAAGGDEVPETVRAAVLARAARLTPPTLELLERICVVPQPVEPWLLAALIGDRSTELDECIGAGLLTVDGRRTSFRHELARLAVEESLPPLRRAELHRRVLAELIGQHGGVDSARLAHHADAAGDGSAVRRFAPEAARRAAAVGAHHEAVAQYTRALRFGDELAAAMRADLLAAQAGSCFLADLYDVGIAALEREIELRRELGDRLAEGDALRRLGEFLWCPGRTDETRRAAEQAVGILETLPPSRALGHAYGLLSFSHLLSGSPAAARSWGAREIEIGELVGDESLAADGRVRVAAADEDVDVHLEEIERSIRLQDYERAAELHVSLAYALHRDARVELLDDVLERGVALCSERGLELFRLYLLAARARHELEQGRWADAAASAGSVLRWPRTSTAPRILSLVVLALVRARRGDPEVEPLLEEAWQLAEHTNEPGRIDPVIAARAEVEWLEGRSGLSELFASPFGPYELAVANDDVPQLVALGANRAAEVISRRLGKRGARPSTRENPAGLTRRELEVLPLIAQGLSNRQVADRLVVSDRTVEHHVTAILRKLGARSRVEASATAVRLGLAD